MANLAIERTTEGRTRGVEPIAVKPLSDEMRQFKKRTLFLSARRPELTRRYPDQWVGIASNGTLVAAPSIEEVLDKLKDKGISKRGFAMKLMATQPRRMIL